MINIIVDNNQLEIEGKKYHSFNVKENLLEAIDVIFKQCLYSGETICLEYRDYKGFYHLKGKYYFPRGGHHE